MSDELPELLERLIDEACPDCGRPTREAPDGEDRGYWAHHRVEVLRLRLSRALLADPELTIRLAPQVFEGLLLEDSCYPGSGPAT